MAETEIPPEGASIARWQVFALPESFSVKIVNSANGCNFYPEFYGKHFSLSENFPDGGEDF